MPNERQLTKTEIEKENMEQIYTDPEEIEQKLREYKTFRQQLETTIEKVKSSIEKGVLLQDELAALERQFQIVSGMVNKFVELEHHHIWDRETYDRHWNEFRQVISDDCKWDGVELSQEEIDKQAHEYMWADYYFDENVIIPESCEDKDKEICELKAIIAKLS